MRVLQINYSAGGSTGKIASAIHEMLLNEGEDAHFVYGRGESKLPQTYRIGNEFDFRLHTYLSRITGLHGYYSYFPTLRLISRINKIKPDIIHLHNIHGGYVNIGMLFSYLRKSKIKTIITLHDCWLFTGGCTHYTNPFCENWKLECGGCKRRHEYPKSYFFDRTKKCLNDKKKWLESLESVQIVTVSSWLGEQARQSFLRNKKVSTIYNGVDTKFFYPKENIKDIYKKYNLSNDKHILLGVASVWTDNKGLNQFVDLRREIGNDFLIVLVGVTEKQIQSLPDGIIGISRTDNQEDLASIYRAATVLINFSKEETFGMVPAEAMACGTPVIVSYTTACPEIVDGVSSFSMDLDDINSLIKKIYWIAENKDRSMCDACINRIREKFSKEQMVSSYWTVYNSMVEEKNNDFHSAQPD